MFADHDHNYAKRRKRDKSKDYENLCKKFQITSLVPETSKEVDSVPAITSSQDLSSDTLPLLVREERPISIPSDNLALSPSVNENEMNNNNNQGSVSPRQQTLVSSSVFCSCSI